MPILPRGMPSPASSHVGKGTSKIREPQAPPSHSNYDGGVRVDLSNETPVHNWNRPRVRFMLSAALLCPVLGIAQVRPQPPCGMEPVPLYPGLKDSAISKSWSKPDLGGDWKPPTCTGWTTEGFTSLATTAARFPYSSGAEGLLHRIGAISELAGMRYWSATHKQWQTLISDAHALTGLPHGQRRVDFSPEEMKEGKDLYFEQLDNLSGKAIYRMQVAEASENRIVFKVENVSTMRFHLIPLFHPGDLQSIYFLDRESENVWRYYGMVRTGKNANWLIPANESSEVNRTVAFYRWLVGIPTDREPPAAR